MMMSTHVLALSLQLPSEPSRSQPCLAAGQRSVKAAATALWEQARARTLFAAGRLLGDTARQRQRCAWRHCRKCPGPSDPTTAEQRRLRAGQPLARQNTVEAQEAALKYVEDESDRTLSMVVTYQTVHDSDHITMPATNVGPDDHDLTNDELGASAIPCRNGGSHKVLFRIDSFKDTYGDEYTGGVSASDLRRRAMVEALCSFINSV